MAVWSFAFHVKIFDLIWQLRLNFTGVWQVHADAARAPQCELESGGSHRPFCPEGSRSLNTAESSLFWDELQKHLHVLVPQFGMTHARYSLVDYTACTGKPDSAFLLPAAQLESFSWSLTKPFTEVVNMEIFFFKNWTNNLLSGLGDDLHIRLRDRCDPCSHAESYRTDVWQNWIP